LEPNSFPGVADSAIIRDRALIREGAIVGEKSRLGISVYVGPGVVIGANCKIQNLAQIYEPAVIGNGCFIGPGTILTNDRYPRAITLAGEQKTEDDWTKAGVRLHEGVSLGASVVCVGPLELGEWSFVAAGSVVTRSFSAYSLIAGNPARRIGWVGRAGRRLDLIDGHWICPVSGEKFVQGSSSGCLEPLR
jgi:UDP-2-acetamido-3-amino-2,3-dideoxy-glucuronate N-acetyltransferase